MAARPVPARSCSRETATTVASGPNDVACSSPSASSGGVSLAADEGEEDDAAAPSCDPPFPAQAVRTAAATTAVHPPAARRRKEDPVAVRIPAEPSRSRAERSGPSDQPRRSDLVLDGAAGG